MKIFIQIFSSNTTHQTDTLTHSKGMRNNEFVTKRKKIIGNSLKITFDWKT
jgi:hypothetical protein